METGKRTGRIPELDGLRVLMIAMVERAFKMANGKE